MSFESRWSVRHGHVRLTLTSWTSPPSSFSLYFSQGFREQAQKTLLPQLHKHFSPSCRIVDSWNPLSLTLTSKQHSLPYSFPKEPVKTNYQHRILCLHLHVFGPAIIPHLWGMRLYVVFSCSFACSGAFLSNRPLAILYVRHMCSTLFCFGWPSSKALNLPVKKKTEQKKKARAVSISDKLPQLYINTVLNDMGFFLGSLGIFMFWILTDALQCM